MTGDRLVTGLKTNLSPEKPSFGRSFLGWVTGDRFFYKHVRGREEKKEVAKSGPLYLSPVTRGQWTASECGCNRVTGLLMNLSPNLSPEVTPCP